MKEKQTEEACEKVSTAITLNDFGLLVTFRNMELRIFDCRSLFGKDEIDRIIFDTVHADGSGVSWKNGITISSEKLYEDSIDLVDFLNEAISGEIKPDTQHDPFFVHGDDAIPDDFFHEQVKMIERTHYNYGKKDEEAAVAERFVKIMQHGGISGGDIIFELRVFLGLDMETALDYFLEFM